ncbi:MAG TPA: hypothetical protein QGH03_02045 [Candidatus Paceibacterota bacterium]|jgi:hypothetical protein|nr:hypothetical protein [Candidatus Paceibacterota bacterium]HJN62990.1 hypothetical protein [Candidatus Paceibacterota bacterium]|tara:strand:- start:496 stop:1035 length:540 start_codon:yes stop_codon:yes gene_type:complete
MSNLLPSKEKSNVKKKYLVRLLGVILVFSLITILLALAFSVPSYFLLKSRITLSKERIDFLESYVEKRKEFGVTSLLLSTNEKIDILSLPETSKLSESIQSVLEQKTGLVKITEFVLRITDGKRSIFVGGEARNRDSLISFSKSLEKAGDFINVDLPVSNLAKNRNISFNLEIELEPLN